MLALGQLEEQGCMVPQPPPGGGFQCCPEGLGHSGNTHQVVGQRDLRQQNPVICWCLGREWAIHPKLMLLATLADQNVGQDAQEFESKDVPRVVFLGEQTQRQSLMCGIFTGDCPWDQRLCKGGDGRPGGQRERLSRDVAPVTVSTNPTGSSGAP